MEQLFGLNPQLLHDTVLSVLAILFLFTLMSYLLFNPAKKMLKDRQDRIKNDIETAKKDREEATAIKAEYDAKIKGIEKEAEEILSEARQKALKNEAKIVPALSNAPTTKQCWRRSALWMRQNRRWLPLPP